jgi:hypothetical protein
LTDGISEYLEIFHNRSRRHNSLGMLTPVEFEQAQAQPKVWGHTEFGPAFGGPGNRKLQPGCSV